MGGVSILGTGGEDFFLARDETVFTDGAGLRAGVDAWGTEKARRSATVLLGGEELLDPSAAARVRAVAFLGNAAVEVVVDQEHTEGAPEGLMPARVGRVRSAQRRADARDAPDPTP